MKTLKCFKILVFWVFRGGGGLKGKKMAQNDKKSCLTLYLTDHTSYDCGFWYTCVKWWYLQQFFSLFQKSNLSGFSKFINKCQKEILRCVPPSSHVCVFLVKMTAKFRNLQISKILNTNTEFFQYLSRLCTYLWGIRSLKSTSAVSRSSYLYGVNQKFPLANAFSSIMKSITRSFMLSTMMENENIRLLISPSLYFL